MNSQRIKRFEALRQKAFLPLAIGATVVASIFGIGRILYGSSNNEEESRSPRKISVKINKNDYVFEFLNNDDTVDVVRKRGSNLVLVANGYENQVDKKEDETHGFLDPLYRINASNYLRIRDGLGRGFSDREKELIRRR